MKVSEAFERESLYSNPNLVKGTSLVGRDFISIANGLYTNTPFSHQEAPVPFEKPPVALDIPVWANPVTITHNDNGVSYSIHEGKRHFDSGATRSVNDGKPRFDLISPLALEWLAQILGAEAADKGADNYLKGIPEKVCIESLLRHVNAYQQGKEADAVNILFNALALCHTIRLRENVAI